MSITYGFYNSLNGDRRYTAEQMSSIFDGIIKDGVFMSIGDQFKVSAMGDMNVTVGSGRAWFNHTWTNNDSDYYVSIPASELVLNRIDAVVLEVNSDDSVRANTIKVISGTPSATPVRPALTKTTKVKQYPLAYITVNAGATAIKQGDISSVIGTSQCPWITGILKTVDTDDLITEWQARFDELYYDMERAVEQVLSSEIPDGAVTTDKLAVDAVTPDKVNPDGMVERLEAEKSLVKTTAGTVATTNDSGNLPFAGLKLYGRSIQDDFPTPGTPAPIVTPGLGYCWNDLSVVVRGKNLVTIRDFVARDSSDTVITYGADNVRFTSNALTYPCVQAPIILAPRTKYTVSADVTIVKGAAWIGCRVSHDHGATYDATTSYVSNVTRSSGRIVYSFTTGDVTHLKFTLFGNSGSDGIGCDVTFSNVQLEVGESVTDYVRGEAAQKININTPNGLPGIIVESDALANFVDANGVKWCCDEIDLEKGVYTQNVVRITDFSNLKYYSEWKMFYLGGTGVYKRSSGNGVMCTDYAKYNGSTADMPNGYTKLTDFCYIKDNRYDASTIADFKEWLTENDVEFLLPIAEPVTKSLTTAELNAYTNIVSNNPRTTVMAEGAHIEALYRPNTIGADWLANAMLSKHHVGTYCSDCNADLESGIYYVDKNTANSPGVDGLMCVYNSPATDGVNIYQFITSGTIKVSRYYSSWAVSTGKDGWQPWEYDCPMMENGVEYRTSERQSGATVYTKFIGRTFPGTIGSATSYADVFIEADLSGINSLARISGSFTVLGTTSLCVMPYVGVKDGVVGGTVQIVDVTPTGIRIRLNKAQYTYITFGIVIYYTKR